MGIQTLDVPGIEVGVCGSACRAQGLGLRVYSKLIWFKTWGCALRRRSKPTSHDPESQTLHPKIEVPKVRLQLHVPLETFEAPQKDINRVNSRLAFQKQGLGLREHC